MISTDSMMTSTRFQTSVGRLCRQALTYRKWKWMGHILRKSTVNITGMALK